MCNTPVAQDSRLISGRLDFFNLLYNKVHFLDTKRYNRGLSLDFREDILSVQAYTSFFFLIIKSILFPLLSGLNMHVRHWALPVQSVWGSATDQQTTPTWSPVSLQITLHISIHILSYNNQDWTLDEVEQFRYMFVYCPPWGPYSVAGGQTLVSRSSRDARVTAGEACGVLLT